MKRLCKLLQAGVALVAAVFYVHSSVSAAPIQINSGSGNFSLPTPLTGVHIFGSAGNRNFTGWNRQFNGFQWNGSDYSSGPVYGILNQTSSSHNFTVFTLNQSMIFDVGGGAINFTNWGSNLQGHDLVVRGSGGSFSHTGSIESSVAGGSLTVESGVGHVAIGGPISTGGGNVTILGDGTGSFNGANLGGGNFIIDGNRGTTHGNTALNTQGGNFLVNGAANHTFNGQILTGGGDFLWTVSGDGQFNNNINAAGGQIRFEGTGNLTFSNPVQTTTLNGDIFIGGSQNVTFQNTISTNGGGITFGDGATVNAQNTINTGGGAFNVVGTANVTTSNTINTGGGDINVTSSGNFTSSGNINTNGGSIYITGDGDTALTGWVTTNDGDIYLTGNGTTFLNNDPTLGTGEIIVIGGGTLVLDADGSGSNTSGTRINVLLEGGTFRTAGKERYIGTLTLSTDSRIDMGTTGSSLMDINTFASINDFNPWNEVSLITIENFLVGGDIIRFNSGSGVVGNEQFFRFEGDYGQGFGIYYASLQDMGNGIFHLTPGDLDVIIIPEPGTVIFGGMLLLAAGVHFWRRRQLRQQDDQSADL